MGVISELKRRNVLRMAVLYALAAWLIMQIAEVVTSLAALPTWVGQTTLLLLTLGFPIALAFSWFYEITPEGLALEKDVSRHESITHITGRRIDFIVIALLCAAVIMLALDKWWVSGPPEQSIAVLPFVNLGDDASGDYLGDGIAEEILNDLANLGSLHVAARTSSFYFKGKSASVTSIAQQLGVGTVLEGSVRKSGNRLRVTAQLIDARNGFHLWSKTFDSETGDIFEIQDEIAESITNALKVELVGGAPSKRSAVDTDDFIAYDYYLLGEHHREKRNPESLDKAIELFNQALILDDQFALAYTGLALCYIYQVYYSDMSAEHVVELTTPLLDRALELNPDLARAHSTRASARLLVGDFHTAESGYRKAIELKPNYAGAWSNLGFSLVRQSRLVEADTAYAKAESLDPLNVSQQFNIGALMMLRGKYEQGLAAFEKVIALAPERSRTRAAIAHWSIVYGRYENAAHWIAQMQEHEPADTSTQELLATLYSSLGMWDKAEEPILQAYDKAPDKTYRVTSVAGFYFTAGDSARFNSFVEAEFEKIDQLAPTRYSPLNRARYFWHGVAAMTKGNYAQAIDDFTSSAGGLEGIENLVYDGIGNVKYIAYALQQQGHYDEAKELLNKCLALAIDASNQGWATPTIHYRTAQVYSLLGQSDEAIEQLQQAIDTGWRNAGELETDPLWYRLQDDVRFQNIIADVNRNLATERDRVKLLLK